MRRAARTSASGSAAAAPTLADAEHAAQRSGSSLRDVEHLHGDAAPAQELAARRRRPRPATSPSTACSRCRAPSHRVARSSRPRSSAARTRSAAVADDARPSSSFDGVASRLYSRNWYAPSTTLRRRPGRRRRVERRAPPTPASSPPSWPCSPARATAAAGAAQAVDGELGRVADADEDRGLGPELARASAPRASRPACPRSPASSRNAPRPPPSAASTTSAPGPSTRARRRGLRAARRRRALGSGAVPTGTASSSAATRSAGVVTTEKVSGTGPPEIGGRSVRSGSVGSARTGRKVPSCQRASVYTRSASRLRYGTTWLSVEPAVVAAATHRARRAARPCARRRARRRPGSRPGARTRWAGRSAW